MKKVTEFQVRIMRKDALKTSIKRSSKLPDGKKQVTSVKKKKSKNKEDRELEEGEVVEWKGEK